MGTTLKLTWMPDLKLESDLKRRDVSYEVVTIPFSKIDLVESQHNGARLKDAIREHKVEDYQQGMLNGDTFPMVVAHKTPTGYVLLGGNQRCESISRLIKSGHVPKGVEIRLYVVDTKDKLLLEIIARSANVGHGEGDSKDERIQNAIHCVRSLGMTVTDAAKTFLVSPYAITHNMRAEDQRNRLLKSGVEAHHVSNAALEPLAKLEYDEAAQLKLGTLIAQHQPPADRVKQVVSVVDKQSNAPARLGKIREFEKELSVAAHSINGQRNGHVVENSKVPQRPRRDKLLTLLSRLTNFLESENDGEAFTDLGQLQVASKADVELITGMCKKLRYRLGVIAK